jgi:hypothetical protein
VEPRRRLSRGRVVTIALLLAWFLAVLLWALQPVDDSVPTGIVNNQQTAQVVHCDSPLSGNDGPTSPPPSLPAGHAYERTACTEVHTQYRALFWIDTALVFVLLALLLTVRRRPQEMRNATPSASTYSASVV